MQILKMKSLKQEYGKLDDILQRSTYVRGLLEKYPTVFFYANTWWIII